MKKAILFILTALMLSGCVYAAPLGKMDQGIAEVLNGQMSAQDNATISDKTLYNDSRLSDFSLNDSPVIKIYNEMYWDYAGASIDEIVFRAESSSNIFDYEVFGDENIRLRSFEKEGKVTIGISPVNSSLNYINDIMATHRETEIKGQPCTINAIFCFDGFTSQMGAAVYYCTDQGVYVKYYESEHTTGNWFTEQGYQFYAVKYYNYLISPENNYDENGIPVAGHTTFGEYIDLINLADERMDTSEQGIKLGSILEKGVVPKLIEMELM